MPETWPQYAVIALGVAVTTWCLASDHWRTRRGRTTTHEHDKEEPR